jgi:hypothetical protein
MDNKELNGRLSFDPLSQAEKITGKHSGEDKETAFLGMGLMIENNQRKNEILDSMDDTKFSNSVESYLRKAKKFGFEVVLTEPFTSRRGIGENLYILWHDELGILLTFDTSTCEDDGSWAKAGKEVPPPSVNGGHYYYNIKLNPKVDWSILSSGSYEGDVWVGDHDCREALIYKINRLKENGEFLTKWTKRPFLWLLHHGDTDGEYDYHKINEERISRLPQRVIDAITPKTLESIKKSK